MIDATIPCDKCGGLIMYPIDGTGMMLCGTCGKVYVSNDDSEADTSEDEISYPAGCVVPAPINMESMYWTLRREEEALEAKRENRMRRAYAKRTRAKGLL